MTTFKIKNAGIHTVVSLLTLVMAVASIPDHHSGVCEICAAIQCINFGLIFGQIEYFFGSDASEGGEKDHEESDERFDPSGAGHGNYNEKRREPDVG